MPRVSLRGKLWNWTGFRTREDQLTIVLSLVIGVIVGLTVVAFILLTGRLASRMYPPESAVWRRGLIPLIGTLISGFLLFRYFPNARGSGIPQAKFALFIQDGYISLRTVVGKFVCCSMSLASGIALGREGPSVQIGAGIASVLARKYGLSQSTVKALVPVGCSAALAAAFNTPIAAVLFSLEEILGDLHAPVLGSVVLSSATSWMVLHLILGDEPLFHVPPYQLVNPVEFGVYAILGIVGGVASVCFVKLLLWLRVWFRQLPAATASVQPMVGGMLMAVFALIRPEVLGVGYDYVDRVLTGDFPWNIVLILGLMKIVATPVCYSSGNAGGIFGPSLFVGAMVGGSVGYGAHALLPNVTANPGAYALVGMGTAFAGIVRTPLTSVIMIFEMTRDYSIIVPLMISNLISFFISQQLQHEPIYEALALQEGVYLPTGESRQQLEGVRVSSVMIKGIDPLPETATPAQAKAVFEDQACHAWPVGEPSHLIGIITRNQVETAPATAATIKDLLGTHDYPFIHGDHPASVALERMGSHGIDAIPVVSRANIHQMFGVVRLNDVLAKYGVGSVPGVLAK
jgi:CIC family chloride channel protein